MNEDPTKIKLQTNVAKDRDPTLVRMIGTTYHGNIDFDVPFMTEVAPNLWLGGCQSGLILPHFIGHLVSLYPWEKYTVKHHLDAELYVRLFDDRTQPVDDVVITQLATLINRWRERGFPVLVHCQAGLNRSSLVAARALMLQGHDADSAIKILRANRSAAVLCNTTFEQYLRSA